MSQAHEDGSTHGENGGFVDDEEVHRGESDRFAGETSQEQVQLEAERREF